MRAQSFRAGLQYPGFNGPALFWTQWDRSMIKWQTPYKIWVLVDFYWKYPRHIWYLWKALRTCENMVIFKFYLTRFHAGALRFPSWLSELDAAGGSRCCAGPANYWCLVLLNSIKSNLSYNKVTQIYNQVIKVYFKINLLVFFFFKLVLNFDTLIDGSGVG